MKSRSEKTQPGNPHGLIYRQHVFPRRSIERFCISQRVDFMDIQRKKRRWARSDDTMFCADRAWNHGAETGFMKRIEDDFQAVVDGILPGLPKNLSGGEMVVVADFFALWRTRVDFRRLPVQHVRPAGASGVRRELSHDELELLEKHKITATRPDGSFAMRDLNTPRIILQMDHIRDHLENRRWGVIRSLEGDFCVPDGPRAGVIPVTPGIALVVDAENASIDRMQVEQINRIQLSAASDYFFARSLQDCPGLELPDAR